MDSEKINRATRQLAPSGSQITEETVLFLGVLKWVFLAVIIGFMVGLSTTVFLKTLDLGINYTSQYPMYYLGLPVALLASVFLVTRFAPDAQGHGTEKVIEAIHKRNGDIPSSVIPIKLIATVVTIAFGGSAGKEGPCAQIGAGVASLFARTFRFDADDRKKLAICGVSAGFAAVFGTPIAGAIFGVEVLYAGSIFYVALLPSFIAGLVAYHTASSLGVKYLFNQIDFAPVFSGTFFIDVITAGIFFGLCSFLFIEMMRKTEKFYERLNLGRYEKAAFGGILLIAFALLFSPAYLGLGINSIQSSLSGQEMPLYAFIIKSATTSITLNFGGSGGVITAIFFIGSTAGSAFAQIMHTDISTFAAIGFVSVLAGAANTPIAASIMAIELFGPQIGPYAAIACVISFLMTGHRSVYPSQKLAASKSLSLETDGELLTDDMLVRYKPRNKTITTALLDAKKGMEKK